MGMRALVPCSATMSSKFETIGGRTRPRGRNLHGNLKTYGHHFDVLGRNYNASTLLSHLEEDM